MKKIFAATHNAGKQKEIRALLADTPIEIIFPTEDDAPEETGTTFVENALIKARHGCRTTGLASIADDSGLVIPALNGAPGLISAHYAGEHGNAKANIEKVLDEMRNIEDRKAFFYSVIVCLRCEKDPLPIICEGFWQGEILWEPVGTGGFGYNPIFYCPEKNCSSAELDDETRNRLNHRGKALQVLKQKLQDLLF